MKKSILDTEKGKLAQENLKVIRETLAPYLPKPHVPHIQQSGQWSISDKPEVQGRSVSPQKNAMACLG